MMANHLKRAPLRDFYLAELERRWDDGSTAKSSSGPGTSRGCGHCR
ncbi:MAG: hypothetical protein IPI73_19775 [Betaproteobacteria bacterium]|nr:hypothetical protein [Betaproteobacteria bacterium]